MITDARFSFLCDFIEHILEANHIEGTFLKGKLHHPKHDDYELFNVNIFIRYFFELLLDLTELLIKHKSADSYRRIIR